MSNLNSSNPLVWVGMKDIRDGDIYGVLELNWNSKMTLVAWAPNRVMTASPENDTFIRSFNEAPWRDQGNVVFFCADGKIVRCHAVLLYGIVPYFVKQLLQMQNFSFNQYVKDIPFMPVSVMGIEQQTIEHLLALMNHGVDYVTGKEVAQLKKVIEVLNIHELVICVAPTDMNMDDYLGGGKNAPTGTEVANPQNPNPLHSMLMGFQFHQAAPQHSRFNVGQNANLEYNGMVRRPPQMTSRQQAGAGSVQEGRNTKNKKKKKMAKKMARQLPGNDRIHSGKPAALK